MFLFKNTQNDTFDIGNSDVFSAKQQLLIVLHLHIKNCVTLGDTITKWQSQLYLK